MSNKEYKSAMNKIEASDTWKTQTLTKMKTAALKQAAEDRQIENARQYLKQQHIDKEKNEQQHKLQDRASCLAQDGRAPEQKWEHEKPDENGAPIFSVDASEHMHKETNGAPVFSADASEHMHKEANGAPIFSAEKELKLNENIKKQTFENKVHELNSATESVGTRGINGPQYKKSKSKKRMIMLLASTAALFFIGFGFVFNAILGQNMGSDAAPMEAQETQPELLEEAQLAGQGENEAQTTASAHFTQESESDSITQIEGVVTQQTESVITLTLDDGSTQDYIINESTVLPEGDLTDKIVIVSIIETQGELSAMEIAVVISQ